ncbi:DUF4476 domain-containing protein [Mucilaginibacter myungsuensis]|uniref:DUF4476 domain-containing protein n=1 Tax=Mucilaginibacter myungsuensis TaxID=649104 RepID=A0A929KY02_9SPHI|nr:DUF4476 domain-containing protein [Mucilaginibacter myungsuensis]MBE9662533.1 DUF4476 domain-containing protein [Mucilaginibacter myungsuensis]MDN3597952.1 DUF4476 domain-containing protein [Mucilaginibacter myungsuensis]
MKKMILALLVLGTVATTQAQDLERRDRDSDRPYVIRVLSRNDFELLQQSVRKAPFALDKKTVLRLGLQNSFITVDQAQVLIKQAAFDDDKLDWLTMLYPRTADVQQFYRLRESLAFSSSKERFDRTLLSMTDNDRRDRRRQRIMSENDFMQLQDLMRKEAFADGRTRVFKLGVHYKLITVSQLGQLLRLMTFDDEKLAVAKIAYDRTADKQRFYTLRDQFTFDSTKQQLDKFLLSAKS